VNPIVCLVRDNLHLTRRAVDSFKAQDIHGGVELFIVNNDSKDNTAFWLATQKDIATAHFCPQIGVAGGWNYALKSVFKLGAEYALVVNNDVELRPHTYRHLVESGEGFVTGVGVTEWPHEIPSIHNMRPHPDFSCFLIRRRVYEQVGPFDEGFQGAYCEDWDYHVRMHKAGVNAYCLDLPFLHHVSATEKSSDLAESRRIQARAEKNREYFKRKWGVAGASEEYYALFRNTVPKQPAKQERDGGKDNQPHDEQT